MTDEENTWEDLVPTCGNCHHPVDLGAGTCFFCESELNQVQVYLKRKPTETV